jgi:hypothetical protein
LNPVDLLVEIIKEHAPEDIWIESPLIAYRQLGNTNRGAIGEEFVRRYLTKAGIDIDLPVNHRGRTSLTDMQVAGHSFEIKTASLGANGTFQFNHVRLDRSYHYLLCLGICPNEIVFTMWRKGEVAEDNAGHLVRMAEGQSVTWKLTKKLSDMRPIADLPTSIVSLKPRALKKRGMNPPVGR